MDAQGPAFGDVWNEVASSARRLHRGSNIVSIAAPGFAFLVAEGEDGAHEPLGPIATIAEAGAMVGEDLGHRMEELERAGEREKCAQRRAVDHFSGSADHERRDAIHSQSRNVLGKSGLQQGVTVNNWGGKREKEWDWPQAKQAHANGQIRRGRRVDF